MRLVIPPTIQIGGHIYSIVFNKEVEDDGSYAQVNHRTQKIELNPIRPKSQIDEAFLHELFHIINKVFANSNLGEDGISANSEGLLQVIRQWDIELDFSQIPEV